MSNYIHCDKYTIAKQSNNKNKIKAEYEYYYLLPESMKMWFVMPYNYTEDGESASYTMEMFHMNSVGHDIVSGAITLEDLESILVKISRFLCDCAVKSISVTECKDVANKTYFDCLDDSLAKLKCHEMYDHFNTMIQMGTSYNSIDEVFDTCKQIYSKLSGSRKYDRLVVNHGDLLLSNVLYSKESEILKFINPYGTFAESDMYKDAYYDLAKLSQSVCGMYECFEQGLYKISINRDLQLDLSIGIDKSVMTSFRDVFKQFLDNNGYDYRLVRICEASLFLSSLPDIADDSGKVFGFLVNAIRIIEEIK